MTKNVTEDPNTQINLKFPKSNSLSNVKTEVDFGLERDNFTRKISDEQKNLLISLITD